jgi:N-acetyl-gamma-glutamyl-phosphate reductase
MNDTVPAVVIGGTGYVAGELLRLISGHPSLTLAAVMSESQAGQAVGGTFGHLRGPIADTQFVSRDGLAPFLKGRVAVFSAAPHGASASLVAGILDQGGTAGANISLVDASADFRFSDEALYSQVYGQAHDATELLGEFARGLPEHVTGTPARHVGNPGCFASAMLLALVPMVAAGLTENEFFASGITGSTGSGRSPSATTHHPQRHSNLFAYKPLAHRHAPEVVHLTAAATGIQPKLNFIPHSGPFARGIHMTVQAKASRATSEPDLRSAFESYYGGQPFIRLVDGMPRVKDVAGSNYADIGFAATGDSLAVFVTLDNLVKGAAGGAMQWMNRLLGFDETAGLTSQAPGWI